MSRKLLIFSLPFFFLFLFLFVPKTGGPNHSVIGLPTQTQARMSGGQVASKLVEPVKPPVARPTSPRSAALKKTKISSVPLDTVRITSKFGPRKHPVLKRKSFHAGVDLAASLNDRVKSISDGIVVYSGARGALGNAVYVSHPKLKVTSIYGHLNKVAVRKGQKVSAGNVIGYAGTTGRSTGVHLHLTVKDQKTGNNVEPVRYINRIASAESTGARENGITEYSSMPRKASLARSIPNKSRTTPKIVDVAIARTFVPSRATSVQSPSTTMARSVSNGAVVAAAKSGQNSQSSPSLVTEQRTLASLELAIQRASVKAATLKNLYSEGIVARNKYLEAQASVNSLRQRLESVQSGAGST